MSVYIRYVLTDDRPVRLEELEVALREVNAAYVIDGDTIELDSIRFALIDITHRGDPICDDDLDLLTRLAEPKKHRDTITEVLHKAKGMVCVQPLNSLDARTDEVLAPLWDWLLANRPGLLAWEGGRFFDQVNELK